MCLKTLNFCKHENDAHLILSVIDYWFPLRVGEVSLAIATFKDAIFQFFSREVWFFRIFVVGYLSMCIETFNKKFFVWWRYVCYFSEASHFMVPHRPFM